MKIRGLLAGLLVAVSLSGCTGSVTATEEATRTPAVTAPSLDETPPPPPDTTQSPSRTGGAMGSGN
ncbi:hypothetical protein [Longimicrobium sp.]|uniref:hypothetical protein n=1 Tax=Longimicrobium sp. TaxID=2029185 RepID=UPI002E378C97|nr:hypothetical protein [Longimicrobium sp.]HEX6037518.1 hypothetical protein [Longimicrobium sp.]